VGAKQARGKGKDSLKKSSNGYISPILRQTPTERTETKMYIRGNLAGVGLILNDTFSTNALPVIRKK